MRTIKFRGVDTSGELIYGNYSQYSRDECAISDGKRLAFVKPETVAQLVGFDKDGKEVYEGDRLINDRDGTHFRAAMNHIYTIGQYRKDVEHEGN